MGLVWTHGDGAIVDMFTIVQVAFIYKGFYVLFPILDFYFSF